MVVQIRNVIISGSVSIDNLEDVFGDSHQRTEGMNILDSGDELLFVEPEDDNDEEYDIYDWVTEDRETRFRVISESRSQDDLVPRKNRINLIVDGPDSDEMLSEFRENFDNKLEIVKTNYLFYVDDPLIPSEKRDQNGAVHSWEFNQVLENIQASVGSTAVTVISPINDREEVRAEFQEYVKELKSKEEWPPSPNYRQTFPTQSVDMKVLENKFGAQDSLDSRPNSEDNTAVYIEFDDGIVGIDTNPHGSYENFVLSESAESFENARENVEKIAKEGGIEINEETVEEVFYDKDEIEKMSELV